MPTTNYLFDQKGVIRGVIGSDLDALRLLEDEWVMYCPESDGFKFFVNDGSGEHLGNVKPIPEEEVPEVVRMAILLASL